jgi:hypothetical protein
MILDLKKCFNAALIPAAVFIVLGLVVSLAAHFVPTLACALGLPVLVIDLVVFGWAGYHAVKEQGMDVEGGAVTGAIAGFVAALIGGILDYALGFLGLVNTGIATSSLGMMIGIAVIAGLVLSVVIDTILGAIMGAIGAYAADMKK